MVATILLIVIAVILLFAIVMFGPRLYHNYQRKRATQNTFAIQNVKTSKNIRPYNAGIEDDVEIIQYRHANWECMTWQLIKMEDGSCLLKNLYTHKTFQPKREPEAGVELYQKNLGGTVLQYWELLPQTNETYLLRLKGEELYAAAPEDDDNTKIILNPLENSDRQRWRLIEQHPIV